MAPGLGVLSAHRTRTCLAVGILLDDMDPDNGPLMVLPGSHRGPVYDHHSYGAFCGAIDIGQEGLDVSGAREVHGRAGSITIHHARLVHGSGMNKSDRQRRVLFFEYAAADAWPLAGIENLHDLEDFNGRMVHGQPTLRPRLEDVPVKMPLPRAPYQGSIYENQRTLSAQYFKHADGATRPMGNPTVGDGLVPSRQRRRVSHTGDHKGRPYGATRGRRESRRGRACPVPLPARPSRSARATIKRRPHGATRGRRKDP